MSHTAYDYVQSNNRKSIALLILMPITFLLFLYGGCYGYVALNKVPNPHIWALDLFYQFAPYMLATLVVWLIITYFYGINMMLYFTRALPLLNDSPKNKQIYRIVENISLTAGLPMPKIYVMDDKSMNILSTGKSKDDAYIIFSQGMIDKLTDPQLRAVVAHEMSHIGNMDIRLQLILIVGIDIFGVACMFAFKLAYMALRLSSLKKGDPITIAFLVLGAIGVFFWVLHALFLPFFHIIISKKRVFVADSTAVLITRDPNSLSLALKMISTDAKIEILREAPQAGVACIYSPLQNITKTHPPLLARLKNLNDMAGQV